MNRELQQNLKFTLHPKPFQIFFQFRKTDFNQKLFILLKLRKKIVIILFNLIFYSCTKFHSKSELDFSLKNMLKKKYNFYVTKIHLQVTKQTLFFYKREKSGTQTGKLYFYCHIL